MIRPIVPTARALVRPRVGQVGLMRFASSSSRPQPQFQPHVGSFSQENVMKWAMTLGIWGAAAGGAVALFMQKVPIFQRDVLDKVPFVGAFFKDETPDSDKPF
ncbi:hypothetical protein BDZ90DRAFT_259904 [Jaminaea rosea]|uniref:Uncharacterized protein n=1 Tax=Jaminaea rosea TaxID=1569628 RepID=A0A316UTE4_9BASI|nr:hypothetical protein BDZ90DRAFT_259904 [Jaminaea rosea]PWN28078.1 hypothetical protein BDZ90DRAFT_259904 [Jaminaea rosea]